VLEGLLDHQRSGRPPGLLAHVLLRGLDDLAYGAGVWAGAVRRRTAAPLLPRFATGTARLAFDPVPAPGAGQPGQLVGTARE